MSSSDSDSELAKPQINNVLNKSRSSSSTPSHRSVSPKGENEVELRSPVFTGSERSHASPSPEYLKSHPYLQNSPVVGTRKTSIIDEDSEPNIIRNDAEEEMDEQDYSRSSQGDEEIQEEDDSEPKIIETEAPNVKMSLGDELFYIKMPNFLSVDTKPYDADEYEEEKDETGLDDEESQERVDKMVENTMRWRQVEEDGEIAYESNSKIVKWSDGSMSLMVGDNIFECQKVEKKIPTHLFLQHSQGFSSKAILHKLLNIQISASESSTQIKTLAEQKKKAADVRFIEENGRNPDEIRKETIRKEGEAIRAANKARAKAPRRHRSRKYIANEYHEDMGDYSDDESAPKSRKEAPLIGANSEESELESSQYESSVDLENEEEIDKVIAHKEEVESD